MCKGMPHAAAVAAAAVAAAAAMLPPLPARRPIRQMSPDRFWCLELADHAPVRFRPQPHPNPAMWAEAGIAQPLHLIHRMLYPPGDYKVVDGHIVARGVQRCNDSPAHKLYPSSFLERARVIIPFVRYDPRHGQ